MTNWTLEDAHQLHWSEKTLIIGLSGLAGSGKDTVADYLVGNHGFVKVSLADPLKRICRDVFDFSDEQLWGPSELRNAPDTRYPSKWHEAPEGSNAHSWQGYLTPRHALQTLGTDWARACSEDVWVNHALKVAGLILRGRPRQQAYVYPKDHEGPKETYEGRAYPTYDQKVGLHDYRPKAEAFRPRGVVIPDVRFKNEAETLSKIGPLWRITRNSAGLTGGAEWHPSETEMGEIPPELFNRTLANEGSRVDLYGLIEAALPYPRKP